MANCFAETLMPRVKPFLLSLNCQSSLSQRKYSACGRFRQTDLREFRPHLVAGFFFSFILFSFFSFDLLSSLKFARKVQLSVSPSDENSSSAASTGGKFQNPTLSWIVTSKSRIFRFISWFFPLIFLPASLLDFSEAIKVMQIGGKRRLFLFPIF